ncbi:MAG: GNAT family N-acetyltransferase [Spirochaetales bacterium]|nr:GNAT family N-acetyltransferase [Spirochaetales bacterium]
MQQNKDRIETQTTPTPLEVKRYASLKNVKKSLWDSILRQDRIICSYDHLRAVEESGINDCDYRYLMIFRGTRLIAHTCVYAMSFELDIFNTGKMKRIIDIIRKRFFPRFFYIKVIECGTPTALGNTISYADESDRPEILEIIVREMEAFAREKNINILIFRDFYEEELFFYNRLIIDHFKRVNMLPNSEIVNDWKSFDDYLSDMRSRYRYRINRFLRSLEKSTIDIEIRDSFSDIAEECTRLWFQIYEHAKEYKREILTPDYFRNMDKYLGKRSKMILFKKGDSLIGFDFVIIDDNTLRPLFVGIDYNYNEENKLYFNILCQSVKMGIERNKKLIEMGITTMNPKLEMGAEIVPLYAFMKHLSPILNKIIPNLFVLFSPKPREIIKHVFNRRYFERIYTDFSIQYLYKNHIYNATAYNISASGIFIKTKNQLKKNDLLIFEFRFPNTINTFTMRGRIVWLRRMKDGIMAGCKFSKNRKSSKEKLKNLLEIMKLQGQHEQN